MMNIYFDFFHGIYKMIWLEKKHAYTVHCIATRDHE